MHRSDLTLNTLPESLIDHILFYLNLHDVHSLSLVSRNLNAVANQKLYRNIYFHDDEILKDELYSSEWSAIYYPWLMTDENYEEYSQFSNFQNTIVNNPKLVHLIKEVYFDVFEPDERFIQFTSIFQYFGHIKYDFFSYSDNYSAIIPYIYNQSENQPSLITSDFSKVNYITRFPNLTELKLDYKSDKVFTRARHFAKEEVEQLTKLKLEWFSCANSLDLFEYLYDRFRVWVTDPRAKINSFSFRHGHIEDIDRGIRAILNIIDVTYVTEIYMEFKCYNQRCPCSTEFLAKLLPLLPDLKVLEIKRDAIFLPENLGIFKNNFRNIFPKRISSLKRIVLSGAFFNSCYLNFGDRNKIFEAVWSNFEVFAEYVPDLEVLKILDFIPAQEMFATNIFSFLSLMCECEACSAIKTKIKKMAAVGYNHFCEEGDCEGFETCENFSETKEHDIVVCILRTMAELDESLPSKLKLLKRLNLDEDSNLHQKLNHEDGIDCGCNVSDPYQDLKDIKFLIQHSTSYAILKLGNTLPKLRIVSLNGVGVFLERNCQGEVVDMKSLFNEY